MDSSTSEFLQVPEVDTDSSFPKKVDADSSTSRRGFVDNFEAFSTILNDQSVQKSKRNKIEHFSHHLQAQHSTFIKTFNTKATQIHGPLRRRDTMSPGLSQKKGVAGAPSGFLSKNRVGTM